MRANKKTKIIFSLIIFFITIVPLLVLSFYVHPATDDFGFAHTLATSSIWKSTLEIYQTMDNRLVGNFLTLLFCRTGNLFLFRLQFFLFILLFFSSIFVLFNTINKFFLKSSLEDLLMLFSLFAFLFVGYNPNIAECFFWHPGIIIWILSIVLFNIFLSLVIYELKSDNRSFLRFITIAFLSFIMTSENEIMFIFMGIFGLLLVYDLIKKHFYDRGKVVSLIIILIIGACIVLFGSGNYIRLKYISIQQHIGYFSLFKYNSLLLRKFFFLYGVVIFNIVLIPFYYSITKNIDKYIAPLRLLFISLIVLLVLFLPSLIAKLLYSFRIQNVVYYFSLILVFVNFINITIWFRETNRLKIKNYRKYLSLAILYLFVGYSLQKTTVLRNIYTDLFTNKVMLFDKEMIQRDTQIRSSKEENIVIYPIKNKPKSIYIGDITNDTTDWKNRVLSNYYDKKTIVLSTKKK